MQAMCSQLSQPHQASSSELCFFVSINCNGRLDELFNLHLLPQRNLLHVRGASLRCQRIIIIQPLFSSVVSRQGSYPGMAQMGGMGPGGPGGPYNQQPGSNSGRMTPQGPPYNTPPSGRTINPRTCPEWF